MPFTPNEERERVCATLKSVAEQYPPGSTESLAIRDAALAHIIVCQRKELSRAYERLRAANDGVLSEETKADLRRHGIEPDALDEEEPNDKLTDK